MKQNQPPTQEAIELLHVLREWSAQDGYKVWREQDAIALIDRFAAQRLEHLRGVIGDLNRESLLAAQHSTAAPEATKLLAVLTSAVPLDHQWRTNLRDMAVAALTAERAEGRRAPVAALRRIEQILVEDTNAEDHPCCGWGPTLAMVRRALADG